MDLEDAIRRRRTHKAYGPEPVDRETLEELLELARWAPNHHLTNPWRFRVLGPETLGGSRRPPAPRPRPSSTARRRWSCASVKQTGDPVQDEEDLCAAACAVYIVLLAAHARGLAGYWRTPGVLRTPEGRAAVGMEADELFVALIHLGRAAAEKEPPERLPPADFVTYLP